MGKTAGVIERDIEAEAILRLVLNSIIVEKFGGKDREAKNSLQYQAEQKEAV